MIALLLDCYIHTGYDSSYPPRNSFDGPETDNLETKNPPLSHQPQNPPFPLSPLPKLLAQSPISNRTAMSKGGPTEPRPLPEIIVISSDESDDEQNLRPSIAMQDVMARREGMKPTAQDAFYSAVSSLSHSPAGVDGWLNGGCGW